MLTEVGGPFDLSSLSSRKAPKGILSQTAQAELERMSRCAMSQHKPIEGIVCALKIWPSCGVIGIFGCIWLKLCGS
jgi:hypothetical protein